MLRVRTHDQIANVNRLTSIAAKEGDALDSFKDAFGQYCSVRSGFSDMLSKTYVQTQRQITSGPDVPITFIHPSTGLFHYNKANIRITYTLRDPAHVVNCYANLRGNFPFAETMISNCNDPSERVFHYTTSLDSSIEISKDCTYKK